MAANEDQRSLAEATIGAFFAELAGTFMFTFSGTATVLAIFRLLPSGSPPFTTATDVGAAIAFAFGVVAAVYVAAPLSGAHLNPAVTVALAIVRRFPWRVVPVYLVAQFAGGILAGLMNWLMFGHLARAKLDLGGTHPGAHVSWWVALVTELVIVLVLMVVVMATAVFERAPGGASTAGVAIGLWVGAAVFLALPISGASLNPARTIGPDVAALKFPDWWIYIVGPLCGAVIGAAFWEFVLQHGAKETVEAAAD